MVILDINRIFNAILKSDYIVVVVVVVVVAAVVVVVVVVTVSAVVAVVLPQKSLKCQCYILNPLNLKKEC